MEIIEKEEKQTARLEMFSDGVFAIAITLLVIELHPPIVSANESLTHALIHHWPGFLAFLIGFFTILICWINHHYMFEQIQKSNGMLMLLNGFKLLVVSFTPFVTALLAEYIGKAQLATAVTIFAFNFAFMGIAMSSIWYYSVRHKFYRPMPAAELRATTRLYLFAGVFSTSIFLLSFASMWAALALSAGMFGIYIFPRSSVAILVKREEKQEGLVVD